MFYFDEIAGKKILKSTLLEVEGLTHFFTTRESVIRSEEKDAQSLVLENKKAICKVLDANDDSLISPQQTHTSCVRVAEEEKVFYPETDALILSNKKQAVFLNFADCTPIILYDTKNKIAAIAHAGWRGTAGMIAAKTVLKMKDEFGSLPENIYAAIGPAISECCYEVGEEVVSQLCGTVTEEFSDCFFKNGEKWAVNLKNINYRQLLAVGLKKIDICSYCTSCSNELFFSYRKEHGTSSRHSAVIKLN